MNKTCLIIVLFFSILLAIPVYGAVPKLISFQGKLTNTTGDALNGTYSITFRIYNIDSGGTALWTETHPSVYSNNGFFNVLLGDTTTLNLPFDTDYWLSVQVESDPEMTPRQRIASVGYSFTSMNLVNSGNITISTSGSEIVRITNTGNVGIGITNPEAKLSVNGTLNITNTTGSKALIIDTKGNIGMGGAPIPGSGKVAVTGTLYATGNIYTSATVYVNSGIGILYGNITYQNAYTNPYITLGESTIIFRSSDAADIPFIVRGATSQSGNLAEWRDSSDNKLVVINSSGSLGIGTTSPNAKLEVNGRILSLEPMSFSKYTLWNNLRYDPSKMQHRLSVSSFGYHTCVLRSNGNVNCYGRNNYGQSENYTGGDAIGIATGYWHTCILKSNGNVDCYGWNGVGQATDYTGGDAIGVAAGWVHTCVLRSNGNVDCYGDNSWGQSADYTGGDAIGVVAGWYHTCVLRSNGNVNCYGRNDFGQTADYTGGDAIGVGTAFYHTCILKNNGNVDCYRDNAYGESTNYTGGDAIGVIGGSFYTCILKSNGNVDCYGLNSYGEANDYTNGDAIGVAAGESHTCILKSNGNVDCYGLNSYGQSDDYTNGDAKNPFNQLLRQEDYLWSVSNGTENIYRMNGNIGIGTTSPNQLFHLVKPSGNVTIGLDSRLPATLINVSTATSSTGSITVNKPIGVGLGDIMIAHISNYNQRTVTPPAGWTLIRYLANGFDLDARTYYKVANDSEPADYTWSLSSSTFITGSILAYRGVDTANPIDAEDGITTSSGTSHSTPSIVTTQNNDIIIALFSIRAVGSFTPPSGMTEQYDINPSLGLSSEGADTFQASIGGTGAKTATSSVSAIGTAQIIALKPTSTWLLGINNNNNASLEISVNTLGTNNYLTISHLGNVGIGTTSPTKRLEVIGTVKATSFEGDGSGLTNLTVLPFTEWDGFSFDTEFVATHSGIAAFSAGNVAGSNADINITIDKNDAGTDIKIYRDSSGSAGSADFSWSSVTAPFKKGDGVTFGVINANTKVARVYYFGD